MIQKLLDWCTLNQAKMAQVLIGVVLLFAGMAMWQRHRACEFQLKADSLAKVADEYKTKADKAESDAKKIKTYAEALGVENTKQEVVVVALRKALAPLPPKARPVPLDAASVAVELSAAGLPGATVAALGPSNLTLPEAKLVLGWRNDAIRVPQLELAVSERINLQAATDTLLVGKNKELDKWRQVSDQKDVALGLRSRETSTVREENGVLRKEIKSIKFYGNVRFYVGVPIAAYVAYRLGKR